MQRGLRLQTLCQKSREPVSLCHWMAMCRLLLSPPLHMNGKPLGESLFCYSACAWQHGLRFQRKLWALLLNKGKKYPPVTWNCSCREDQKHKSSKRRGTPLCSCSDISGLQTFTIWGCKSSAFSRLWIYWWKKILSSRCYGRKLKHKKFSSRH